MLLLAYRGDGRRMKFAGKKDEQGRKASANWLLLEGSGKEAGVTLPCIRERHIARGLKETDCRMRLEGIWTNLWQLNYPAGSDPMDDDGATETLR